MAVVGAYGGVLMRRNVTITCYNNDIGSFPVGRTAIGGWAVDVDLNKFSGRDKNAAFALSLPAVRFLIGRSEAADSSPRFADAPYPLLDAIGEDCDRDAGSLPRCLPW